MTKLELAIKILEIQEQKFVDVKAQRFEDAAALRDLERRTINEYVETYGYISSHITTGELKELIKLLKAESRERLSLVRSDYMWLIMFRLV